MSIEQMTTLSVILAIAGLIFAVFAVVFYRKKDLKGAGYALKGKSPTRKKEKATSKKQIKNRQETQPLDATQVITDLVTTCMDEETILLQEQEEPWIVLQDITYVSEAADHFLMGSVK